MRGNSSSFPWHSHVCWNTGEGGHVCGSGNQSFCLSSSFSLEESELVQLPYPEQSPCFKLFILRRKVFLETNSTLQEKWIFKKYLHQYWVWAVGNCWEGCLSFFQTKTAFPIGDHQAKGDTYADQLSYDTLLGAGYWDRIWCSDLGALDSGSTLRCVLCSEKCVLT